jgi:hypothetical protein
MESIENQTKAYITTLKFGNLQKRVTFEGNNSEEGELNFQQATKFLNEVGDRCRNWEEFFSNAVDHYRSYGFNRIKL